MYLNPLSKVASSQFGIKKKLQILIDVKSESIKTLNRVIKSLNYYPEIIDEDNISIVIWETALYQKNMSIIQTLYTLIIKILILLKMKKFGIK